MPAYQGEFDGLCGMYAIANAYEICGYGDISKLFKVACDALAPRRWPAVLWDGTSFGDMKKMISVCQTEIEDQYDEPITVNYPFSRNPPKSNENAYCAIVSLTKPSPHWIVISRDTRRRVWFTDSGGDDREYRKNLASLHAGERRRWETQWLLDRRELIVFSVRNDAGSERR